MSRTLPKKIFAVGGVMAFCGCHREPPPTILPVDVGPPPSATASATARASRAVPDTLPTPKVFDGPDDPLHGVFTLADATRGLPSEGKLVARIETSMGDLSCDLFADKAPITVAHFIGFARGTRPWKTPAQRWEARPVYDGTVFHRVIEDFMIQGGDPNGSGQGEPGFMFPDELWPGAAHDRAGQLCIANRGANTNGYQFFITDGKAAHLDRSFTIFGQCKPETTVHAIASVAVSTGNRPTTPVEIRHVHITRNP